MRDKKIPRPWCEWDYREDCIDIESRVRLEFDPNEEGFGSFIINVMADDDVFRPLFVSVADEVAEYIMENPEEFGLRKIRCKDTRHD